MKDVTEMAESIAKAPLNRRTIVQGIAWTAPAVMALGATPAFAATIRGAVVITSKPNFIFAGTFLNGSATPQAGTGNVAAVTISGTTPALNVPQTITVTIGSVSGTFIVPANQTNWSVTLNASSLTNGNLSVNASSSSALVTPASTTITKDTVPPAPAITSASYSGSSTKFLTVNFTLGNAASPTADATSATLTGGPTTPVTVSGTNYVFSNVNNNVTYRLRIVQTDGAGNSFQTAEFTYTT